MLCACIDIGSNTTRVLVADARGGRLIEVLQRRAFTRLSRGLRAGAAIAHEPVDEIGCGGPGEGVLVDMARAA